tara:strand:+ start:21 stop:134 length:114 start_codon:yes stop_codon:yes gene_type:complete
MIMLGVEVGKYVIYDVDSFFYEAFIIIRDRKESDTTG